MQILKDILKVNDLEKSGEDKYSLARVFLFISLIAYISSAIAYMVLSLNQSLRTDIGLIESIMNSLQYPILIFSGYSFGGKSLKVLETIMSRKSETKSD